MRWPAGRRYSGRCRDVGTCRRGGALTPRPPPRVPPGPAPRPWAPRGGGRPGADGGRVVVVADGGLAAVQALVRFDPRWLAGRELEERRELGFPPAVRMASVTGSPSAVADLLAAARLPDGVEELGPVPV